jgi:hypothetical protein
LAFCEQPVGNDFGQEDNLAPFGGMAHPVDMLPARAGRQTVHAQD